MAVRKILVLGATGATGQEVVSQALRQGHEVTALVRNAERLPASSEHVRALIGSVTTGDEAPLTAAVGGQDAVISALGTGKSLKAHGLMMRAIPAIVRAMEAQGVRRLVFMSAYGVGLTYRDTPRLPRILIQTLLKDIYADKNAGEDELHRIGDRIDWTLVHAVTLVNGASTGRYRAGERLALRGLPRISRADIAGFMLAQLDDTTYFKKSVLVAPA